MPEGDVVLEDRTGSKSDEEAVVVTARVAA